jgi:hypothetical protein
MFLIKRELVMAIHEKGDGLLLLSGTQKVITSLILVVIELVSNTLCTTFMIVCSGIGFQVNSYC